MTHKTLPLVSLRLALALCALSLGPRPAQADDDPLADLGGDDDPSTSPASASAPDEEDAPSTTVSADEEEVVATEAATEPATEPQSELLVNLGIGAGLGMRGLERPLAPGEAQVLADQGFAALDLGLHAYFMPDARLGVEASLRFQTSVGTFKVISEPPLGPSNQVDMRNDRVELALTPVFRLADRPDSLAIGLALGGSLRSLWHRRHELNVPRYSLLGAMVRPELRLPLGGWLALRVGPEFTWFFISDETLADNGVDGPILALGGEAALAARVNDWLALEITYREAVAMGAGTPVDFADVERYITARLLGTL